MTTSPTANLPGKVDAAEWPYLICTKCGTSNGLKIEALEGVIPASPDHVSIEYSCSDCDSFYGHRATVQQVARLLNASTPTLGVLRIGRAFIHCGQPMTETLEADAPLGDPASGHYGCSAENAVRFRLLKCNCGFQLDVQLSEL
ncbi:hypothetical protein [Arthrobacter sp.]|uniref:hypothetical protein n=1 Tax=Arthrobacter sp. TaxID=1667 RepID=UPI0026E09CC4|nr:hypothetical protein [Arthrobacter sp.]MDO5753348.1 hypothetical protein [Arthrobacter sp.]